VQRHAKHKDDDDAHGERHRAGPQHVDRDQHRQLQVTIGEMRREQSAAYGRNLRGHHGQQPDSRHLFDGMALAGEHHEWDQEAAGNRHGGIEPPQDMGNVDRHRSDASQPEHEKAVENGRQAHRNAAEEHRHDRMAEDSARPVEIEHPPRRVERGKEHEEADIEHPQAFGDRPEARNLHGQSCQGERKDAGAHRHREPVRGELAHHFARMFQAQQWSPHQGGRVGGDRHGGFPSRLFVCRAEVARGNSAFQQIVSLRKIDIID
jgi:hypothetical protein